MIKYIIQNAEINIQIFSRQSVVELDKQQIISEHHLAVFGGHREVNQTVKRIQKQFDWEGLSQDVIDFISKCSSCQMNKTSSHNTKQPIVISTTASEPFERVFIDVVCLHSNLSRKCVHSQPSIRSDKIFGSNTHG